jgi:hypothetical protein
MSPPDAFTAPPPCSPASTFLRFRLSSSSELEVGMSAWRAKVEAQSREGISQKVADGASDAFRHHSVLSASTAATRCVSTLSSS